MEKPSVVLVTGGAGFIASHLVDDLMRDNLHVKVLDNLSSGSRQNLTLWENNPNFQFIRGDLKNQVIADDSVRDAEVIFHFAANADVRLGEFDPAAHFRENLIATFTLLEAMRKSKKAKTIVFASSSAVYGEPLEFPTCETYGPLFPISIYGATKLACESLTSSYCHTFGLKAMILRFANIVGLRSTHGVILDFIDKVRKDPSRLEILGDGNQKKSYLHVRDLVKAISVIMDDFVNKGKVLEVYNVGSSDQVNVKRIAEIVCQEMGEKNVEFRFSNALKDGRGWRGDVKEMQLSIDKLTKLGWQPSLQSEEAVRQSCRELLDSSHTNR
jgi:UDP-glucose 4-epimerase